MSPSVMVTYRSISSVHCVLRSFTALTTPSAGQGYKEGGGEGEHGEVGRSG